MKRFLIAVVILIFAFPCLAQVKTSTDNNIEKTADKKTDSKHDINVSLKTKKSSFVILPILFYTPETQVMGGLTLMYVWTKKHQKHDDQDDVFALYFIYTQLHQIITGFNCENYISGGKFYNKTGVSFRKFPDEFYGIGPNTKLSKMEKFTPMEIRGKQSFLWGIFKGFYLGPTIRPFYNYMLDIDPGKKLDSGSIPGGKNEILAVGSGFELIWDKRNNYFYPSGGFFAQVILLWFHEYLSMKSTFFQVELDYRYFHQIYKDHVFALNYWMVLGAGETPFQLMPRLGGMNYLRGYYEGRYRDRNAIVIQGEYRFPIFWRFNGAVFCGIGQVARSIDTFDFYYKNLKPAAGFGIRVMVSKEKKINIRFDVAFYDIRFKEDMYGLYLSYTEAF